MSIKRYAASGLAGVLATVVAMAALPSSVQARGINPVVLDRIDDVAQSYQRLAGDAEAACSQACDDIVRDAARAPTAPADPIGSRLIESFVDDTTSAVRSPWIKPAVRVITKGSVVAGLLYANYRVWRYGVVGPLVSRFYVKVPDDVIESGLQLRLTFGDSWMYMQGTTAPTLPDPLPVGLVAWQLPMGTVISTSAGNTNYPNDCFEWGPPVPAGMTAFHWNWNSCIGVPTEATGWKVPLNKALQTRPPDGLGGQEPPEIATMDSRRLTPEEAVGRVTDVLSSDNPDYEPLGDWYCAVLGGACKNPKDAYPTTPDCTGTPAAACTQAFRDAGFVGDITTQTLDADQAVMETDAGRVTATYPHGGIEIAAPRTIRIYVNPDPMPTMTTTELSLADTLETQNPTTVNGTNKRTLAKTCSEDMAKAGRPASECLSLPILVMGNDQETPARNALQGLLRNPAWVVLNARISKNLSRGNWYRDLAEPAPGCLAAERKPANASCDEYPFWSTLQGHGGTLSLPGLESSIRWAPDPEQRLQAKVINQFYSRNSPGQVMQFHGCGITKQPPTDPLPTLVSAFIVMPLPFGSAIQSTGVCNKLVPTDDTPDPTEDPNP